MDVTVYQHGKKFYNFFVSDFVSMCIVQIYKKFAKFYLPKHKTVEKLRKVSTFYYISIGPVYEFVCSSFRVKSCIWCKNFETLGKEKQLKL